MKPDYQVRPGMLVALKPMTIMRQLPRRGIKTATRSATNRKCLAVAIGLAPDDTDPETYGPWLLVLTDEGSTGWCWVGDVYDAKVLAAY